jgi:hypothetical protein
VPAHWRSPSTGLGRSCSDSLSLHTRRDITIITKALEPSLRTTHVARPASLNLTTQDSKPSDAPHDITASSARQILVAILRMHMSSAAMMPLNAGISARHLLRLAVLLNGDHPPDNRRGSLYRPVIFLRSTSHRSLYRYVLVPSICATRYVAP